MLFDAGDSGRGFREVWRKISCSAVVAGGFPVAFHVEPRLNCSRNAKRKTPTSEMQGFVMVSRETYHVWATIREPRPAANPIPVLFP